MTIALRTFKQHVLQTTLNIVGLMVVIVILQSVFKTSFSGLYLKGWLDMEHSDLLAILCAFIVLISVSMNITSIYTRNGMRHIGIRKTLGAGSRDLIIQAFVGTIILSLVAGITVFIIIDVFKPFLGSIMPGLVQYFQAFNLKTGVIYILLLLFVGLVVGIYPAIFLARVNLAKTLRLR